MALTEGTVDDVERLFRCLVDVLAAQAPERLHRPIPLTELYETIVPYRRYRRELGIAAIEDYEMALLRLLAGEGGLATVEPADVREFFQREARSVNPNPRVFKEMGNATVTLRRDAVRRAHQADEAYAPPAPDSPQHAPTPPSDPDPIPPPGAPPAPAPLPHDGSVAGAAHPPALPPLPLVRTCPACGSRLPQWRRVFHCPFCGERTATRRCERCGDLIEPGWLHCVTCGETAGQ